MGPLENPIPVMKATKKSDGSFEQVEFPVPNLTIKDLLDVIPAHCFERSALRSVWDLAVITASYQAAVYADSYVKPEFIALPYPELYRLLSFSIWSLYGFFAGLFAFGLWIVAHECGHQAFSESKALNNAVGLVLHSGLGVPYHSWRISHGKHHAATCHVSQDQVFVPRTRSEVGLPPLNEAGEDLYGTNVSMAIRNEMWEALGDSPIGAMMTSFVYLFAGLPLYIVWNTSGQRKYPPGTNHLQPGSRIFAPHQHNDIVISVVGIVIWLALIGVFSFYKGFHTVLAAYIVPYLWVNHWLALVTFLQHTSQFTPHYRAGPGGFTFVRGALATVDRSLLGDVGLGWLAAHATHGISETHVLHHVSSKIPHYHAWEAADCLRKRLAEAGLNLQGAPGGWVEVYRTMRQCMFIEDDGQVVFYKNAHGLAAARPVFADQSESASDSGVELDTK